MVRPRQRPFSLPVAGAKTCHQTLLARACVLQSPIPLLIPLSSVACRAAEGLAAADFTARIDRTSGIGLRQAFDSRCTVEFVAGKPREMCPGYRVLRGIRTGLCSGTARGLACARRQLALLLRLHRPAGYGFPRNLVRKPRRKDFSGPSVNAELRHLGAWPTRS